MWRAIKKVILWNYGRTTWQYEVLCVFVLAFIFLTPPSWFSGKERSLLPMENAKVIRLIVSPDNFSPATDNDAQLERVRELSGNKNAQRFDVRERRDSEGRLTAYEVDVR